MAICGYPPLALQIINDLKNSGVECTHFVRDFVSNHGETGFQIPPPILPVTFFDFRRMIDAGEFDGLIIAEFNLDPLVFEVVKICKLYDIPNVNVVSFYGNSGGLYQLDSEKAYIPYFETNIIDSCNLNCKGCTHYANLFSDEDFYRIEDFRRDIKQLSKIADIVKFRLLGGEPFKLKNLDEYVKIARKFLPNTDLRVVTNGLLIPSTPQYIFEALRENRIIVDISLYPPTLKMTDKIHSVLEENKVFHIAATGKVETFNTFLTMHGGHDPFKSRVVCCGDGCRFLRNGKIYKCPVDALSFKLTEHFGIKDFPAATGIDIFAKNFSAQIEKLGGNIELCTWCNETARKIAWTPENNPKLTDWLANPAEIENFLPK